MSEYWVSQGRRMCPYCKCWTADNKASINFHEQGKNHKENVKRKLDELRKKGLEDARKRDAESSDMAKIEKAALESYKKDLAANKGVSSAYGTLPKASEETPSAIHDKAKSNAPQSQISGGNEQSDGDWVTAYTDEGHPYYWNSKTNETSWYPPGQTSESDVENKSQTPSTSNVVSAKSEKPAKPEKPAVVNSTTGYGQWEKVATDTEESITDYDLPTDSKHMNTLPEDIPLPPTAVISTAADSEPKTKFKEKRVELSSGPKDSGPVAFKKPKMARKRQARGALDDE